MYLALYESAVYSKSYVPVKYFLFNFSHGQGCGIQLGGEAMIDVNKNESRQAARNEQEFKTKNRGEKR